MRKEIREGLKRVKKEKKELKDKRR